jgi:integrase
LWGNTEAQANRCPAVALGGLLVKDKLTDRRIKALKAAKPGKRYDVPDGEVRGLGVRVSDKGQRTFVLIARYPGSDNPTRRALGEYPTLSLADARDKARHWRELIRRGIDPKVEEERARLAEIRKNAVTFGAVTEDFVRRHVKGHRQAREAERLLRKHLIVPWGDRPISDISRTDVVQLIEEIGDRSSSVGYNVFGLARTLFSWAINRGTYGLEVSPCDRIRPATLLKPKEPRQRTLTDNELRAFWNATEKLGYPMGPLYRLLLLTGCRRGEVAGARRGEVDLAKRLWTIPPERFKSNATHLVPLSDAAIALLHSLPRFAWDDRLFPSIGDFSRHKMRLDQLMAQQLGASVSPWVIHDLRRTVRTRLSSLKIPSEVAERIIGHGARGLARVYNQHQFLDESREALELWAVRLRDIVEPPPENVVGFKARA